ncbi:MAG: NADH-quinone oxidoreductase subunit NuoE [Deltaproteobacteria bacterium]|nr:NADH-quinone oxidoreductase subunit NuoE [Deltaproteobacteria bacterium]
MNFQLSEEEVQQILARYPHPSAALLPMLRLIQGRIGYIPPGAEVYAAETLGVDPVRVHEVVTFYSAFREKPAGRYLILVCESISCSLSGGENILSFLKDYLKLDVGETTEDRRFTLETTECLAQCERSPAVMINGEIHAPATPDEVEKILSELA